MFVQSAGNGSFERSGSSLSGQQLPPRAQFSEHEHGWQQDVKLDAMFVCQ